MLPDDSIINCKFLSPEIVFVRKTPIQAIDDNSPNRFFFLGTSNEESCIISLNDSD